MNSFRLYLFGSPHLERDGSLVEMDTRKALALLAVLALSGQEQQRESLAALLYPEANTESARAAFRRTLSTLKQALGAGVLAVRREAVGLAPASSLWVDVLQFKHLLSQQPTISVLEQAAGLYRNDFLAGFSLRDSPTFDDWQFQQSEGLRRLLTGALDRLATFHAAAGDFDRAIQHAARRAELDPLLEESHRLLMLLYAQAGQSGAALRQYRECTRILEQELGVPPLEETTRLYQEILSGRMETFKAQPSDNGQEMQLTSPLDPKESASRNLTPTPSLVGREAEIAILAAALHSAQPNGNGLLISVEGEAGIGKTRLAEEFLDAARQAGHPIVRACCYEGEASLAYGPLLQGLEMALEQPPLAARIEQLPVEILAESSRLLPGLTLHIKQPLPAPLPDGPGAQTRFFEALRRLWGGLLAGENPGILFIDDLHWADSATLDFFAYLVRRLNAGSAWILTAWRGQEGANSERLHQLLAEQQRAGRSLHLPLRRMNVAEIGSLARGRLNAGRQIALSSKLEERLFLESEGLPFIALEYLRSLETTGGEWKIPGSVRDMLHHRLQAPAEPARQLLTAAAVIGRPFDFNTLQTVSGRSELETIMGVEELLGLGLLADQAGGYDFTHQKLRSVAYEEISQARRRLLHLRAGEALAVAYHNRAESGAVAGLAAGHFVEAGQTARAADFYRQAGEHARRLFANSEALAAFQAALACGHLEPAGLHEACGDLYTLLGNYPEAVTSYQTAAAFCTPACLSNLMHKLGEVYHRLGDWEAAEGHYRAALDAAGKDGSPAWLSHLFADWSLTSYRRGQIDPARRLADQALEQALAAHDPGALAQALNMLGILSRARGALEEAESFFESSLESAKLLEDTAMRCAALNNLARLLQERDRPREAIPLARQALELCIRLGDRHRQAAIQNNLADLYHAAGLEIEAMNELKQAVALFAEIGENAGSDQPEIWKLTEW